MHSVNRVNCVNGHFSLGRALGAGGGFKGRCQSEVGFPGLGAVVPSRDPGRFARHWSQQRSWWLGATSGWSMGVTPVWEQARAVGSLDRRLIGTTSSVPKSPKKNPSSICPICPICLRVASLMMPHVPAANRPSLLNKNPPGRPVALVAAGPQDLGAQQETFSSPPLARNILVSSCVSSITLVCFYLHSMVTVFF